MYLNNFGYHFSPVVDKHAFEPVHILWASNSSTCVHQFWQLTGVMTYFIPLAFSCTPADYVTLAG